MTATRNTPVASNTPLIIILTRDAIFNYQATIAQYSCFHQRRGLCAQSDPAGSLVTMINRVCNSGPIDHVYQVLVNFPIMEQRGKRRHKCAFCGARGATVMEFMESLPLLS